MARASADFQPGVAADGLFDKEGRFHCMPAADLGSMTELFRHRFLHALREGKHLSARKTADLLSWKHSGFHIDSGGEAPIAPHDTDGRKRLAEPERSGDRQPARLPAG